MKNFILLMMLLLSLDSFSRVREVSLNDEKMLSITLRLGRSTLIKIPNHIVKVIIGNSNYYQFEFEGSEITLKPQDVVATNLFLKTKNKTYGFIINVTTKGSYDDLIKVKDKIPKKKIMEKAFSRSISLKNGVVLSFFKGVKVENSNLLFFEGYVYSATRKVPVKNLSLRFERRKRPIPIKEIVFSKKEIAPKEFVKFRVYVEKEHLKSSVRAILSINNEEGSVVLPYSAYRGLVKK